MSKILGNGAPTINTPGAVGQEYLDKSTGTVYMCTQAKHYPAGKSGESDGEYTWEPAGGSSVGDGGRTLKSFDAQTFKEIYDTLLALDNPVVFRVTTNGGLIEFDGDGAGGQTELFNNTTRIVEVEGMKALVITEWCPTTGTSETYGYDGENLFVESYSVKDNETITADTLDFSNVKKFTVYYF